MKAVLLGMGAGRADPDRYNPSNLVWLGDEPVLVDCGNGALLRMQLNGSRISTAQVDHGLIRVASFAYRFDAPDGTALVFSGDTLPCDGIRRLARNADVLVYESTYPEREVELRKQHRLPWQIHSTPRQAGQVARDAGIGRLVLNHFAAWDVFTADKQVYDWDGLAPPSAAEEWDGEVVVGADLLEIETA